MDFVKVFISTLIIFLLIISNSAKANTIKDEKIDYTPKIMALIRAKAEQNLSKQNMNFMVRNARFGLKGKLLKQLSYKIEIDWMDKEEIDMNDAKLIYQPIDNLEFTIGQFKVPFANDYIRNPADYSFANRNFITKRIAKNLRDVGLMVGYTIPFQTFKSKFEIGVFNGNSSNSFEHDFNKAIAGKISFISSSDVLVTLSGLNGQITLDKANHHSAMAEMLAFTYSHNIKNIFIEFESAYKGLKDSISTKYWSLYGILVYNFHIKNSQIIKICPAIRFDSYNKNHNELDESPRRITAGVTFHLKENNNAYFRLDYEKYFYNTEYKSKNDMITLEYVLRI